MRALAVLRRTAPRPHRPAPRHTRTVSQALMVQRTCACGGGCPACEEKKSRDSYEQEAERAAESVMNGSAGMLQLAAVSDHSPNVPGEIAGRIESQRGRGEPLPERVAAFMEERFGHDFSDVRVHHGSEAAELAGSVQARAFTTGQDVFFGAGEFAPETDGGQRLLAHELAHTVQQESLPAPALQRQLTAADLGSITALGPPFTSGAVFPEEFVSLWLLPQQCDPYRALTLDDFVVSNTLPAGKAGRTDVDFLPQTMHGVAGFKAKFLDTSAMRPEQKNPETACVPLVDDCKAKFDAGSARFRINQTPTCAASPTVSGVANTKDECDTVIGAACNPAAQEESDRVLAHEQLHFDIACVVVAKANLALWRGRPGIDRSAIVAAFNPVNGQYETDTAFGCTKAQQEAWEKSVRVDFLPSVTF